MNVLELFAPITTFVFDIHGVLTDDNLYVTEGEHIQLTMNVKDGYALQLAVKKGYNIWIIFEGESKETVGRLKKLGIHEVHIGISDKKEFLKGLVAKFNTQSGQMLYMADDIPDLAAMQLCALPCCPNDAVPEIKQVSKYISPYNGGNRCVRDVIEKVLKLNGHWELPE